MWPRRCSIAKTRSGAAAHWLRLFKQGRGAVRKPAEPGRVGRRVQEPGLHGLLVGAKRAPRS